MITPISVRMEQYPTLLAGGLGAVSAPGRFRRLPADGDLVECSRDREPPAAYRPDPAQRRVVSVACRWAVIMAMEP